MKATHMSIRHCKFLTANSIIGDKVQNDEGEHLGHIKRDIMLISVGKIEYYVIEFGGFLATLVKNFRHPFSNLLKVDPEHKLFRFNVKREVLEKSTWF